ncbi:MAG: HDOD domain-containing protein [Pseudomonadales bacterium]
MHKEINQIRNEIVEAIESDKLELPTLPEVAMQVRKVASDPSADCNHLMKVISGDAGVSTHMLRLANSPLMRRSENSVTDLRQAIMQMGFGTSANLAVGIAITQMFTADSRVIGERMRAAVKLSKEVAGLCQVVCKFSTKLQPEVAMLSGLVHNIGVLPVLKYAQSAPSLLKQPQFLDMAVCSLHPELGDRILKHWEFDAEICSVPSQHLEFSREIERVDYADIVTFALLQCSEGTDSPYADIDRERVTALRRLNIDAANDDFNSDEMQERLKASASSFG